jgi:hypothetical protein
MRVTAKWVYSKEHLDQLDDDPTWITIGFITSEVGGIILLVALILGGIGVRKARGGGGAGLLRASTVLAAILIAVYVVTVWAMGGKPN